MHCPNCGSETITGQKYCRGCGLSLEPFARMLAELLPDGDDEKVANARKRLRQLERAAQIAGWTAGSALGILFASLGVYIMITSHVGGGIFLLSFGIALIASMFFISYLTSLNKVVSGRADSPLNLTSAETTNKLLSEDQPQVVMSVTENTTAKLAKK